MVGTLRANGWPRISPCEVDFVAGELLLGMMRQSPKARDLVRDERCVLHRCTCDRLGSEGDFKLYLFAVDGQSAGFVSCGDEPYGMAWDPAHGTRRWTQRLE